MLYRSKTLKLAAAALALLGLFAPASAFDDKNGEKKTHEGTPVLWRAPDDIISRDLYLGPGGEAMRPDLRRVTFLKEETGGYSKKFRVRDASGREWVAKLGKEAQSETAAVRLVWAVGYMTEINYLAPCVRIEGAPPPRGKDVEACEGGGFANVRFEARPEGVKRLDEWKWSDNPFVDTKELKGLVVMMALVNNWDIKDSNNKILYAPNAAGGRGELRYIVSDLGATFGRVKWNAPVLWRIRRNRNDAEDYAKDEFLEDVKRGQVYLFYKGKRQDLFDDIRVEEARWIGSLLSKLSGRQIADAFRAANYTPEEIRTLTDSVRARIADLTSIPESAASAR
ncbi:MAG TPA: hypothetical protein VE642_08875 [Pyrinomonadaceae bacterium]|jgi:hypothetical protein|nr:hypothetical protein [Pyrinomonadaceae bacterium]